MDSRAEVAILTRSIVLQGPAGALAAQGPQAFLSLSSVELRGLGTFGQTQAAAVQLQDSWQAPGAPHSLQGCAIHGSTAAGLAAVNVSGLEVAQSVVVGSVGSSLILQNSSAFRSAPS